jgi:hypothetical protein
MVANSAGIQLRLAHDGSLLFLYDPLLQKLLARYAQQAYGAHFTAGNLAHQIFGDKISHDMAMHGQQSLAIPGSLKPDMNTTHLHACALGQYRRRKSCANTLGS